MSSKVSKNKITLTRGDTFTTVLTLTRSDGTEYTPVEGDSIRFALKHPDMNRQGTEYVDEQPLIEKSIPYDTLQLKLDPNDTKELGFGKYVYDIEITYANGDVDTVIAATDFTLTPEVH